MKAFLAVSFALAIIACVLVFSNEQKAQGLPVSYNVSALSNIWTTLTLNSAPTQNFLMDNSNNGTITNIYNATRGSSTLKYILGNHPTLPITLDTVANMSDSSTTRATEKLNVTIASGHTNNILVVGISYRHDSDPNTNNRISTVKIGTNSFTKLVNKTVTCAGRVCSSELWYMPNSTSTGFTTITITPVSTTTYQFVAGVYSIYNARALNATGVSTSANGTSVTPSITLTPTFKGTSYLIDNVLSLQSATTSVSTDTMKWVAKTSAIMGASQIKLAPTISGPNTMTYTTTNVRWQDVGIEIIPLQDQTTFNWNLSLPLLNNANINSGDNKAITNGSKFYWLAVNGATSMDLRYFDVTTGLEKHVWYTSRFPDSGTGQAGVGITGQTLFTWSLASASTGAITTSAGNQSIAGGETLTTTNNQYFQSVGTATLVFHWDNNSTTPTGTALSPTCAIFYTPTSVRTTIDSINCDRALSGYSIKYSNGLLTTGAGNYGSNSTLNLLNSILNSNYKTQLTIPSHIYGIQSTNYPDVRLVGHWSGQDWLISYTSTKLLYSPMTTVTSLINSNRALQTYMTTLTTTDSHYYLSPSTISPLIPIKLYGPGLNASITSYGMVTIPSGYTMRTTTTSESIVRPLDPRWTNTAQNPIPAITTTGSQFPLFITVSNAPTDSAMMLTNPAQTINNINSAWCITQLDSTRTAECDIPPNQCALVYVADISIAPTVFTYEGSVCATGTNTKTLAYTNTLPLTFYTLRYGATESFSPTTNGLAVTTRSSTSPFTYNIIIKNSTGTITQNFTATINGTIDTHNFNLTNTTKPAGLFVSVPGVGQIYSAYVGSPLSFASTVSFFHQYLSYQGFDLLSFIPLIFASMFTRNTVGIGVALTVVLIATLSFLSIVVVSDTVVVVSMIVAIIGLIGYRGLYG